MPLYDYRTSHDLEEFFQGHIEIFNDLIDQLDDLIGWLYDDRYYSMDDFDELLSGKSPSEIADMVAFGEYSPSDSFWRFDGYGNIQTSYIEDYEDYLSEYTYLKMAENLNDLYFPDSDDYRKAKDLLINLQDEELNPIED